MRLFISAMCLTLAAPAGAQTVSEIAARIAVKGGALDREIEVSSYNAVVTKSGVFIKTKDPDSVFLRAFLNKKDRSVETIQVYYVARFTRDWRFYNAATYESADGVKDGKFTRIGGDVSYCGRYGCGMNEDMIFEVPVETLRWVLSSGKPQWRFKFFSQAGIDNEESIPAAEIEAFLKVLDRERNWTEDNRDREP